MANITRNTVRSLGNVKIKEVTALNENRLSEVGGNIYELLCCNENFLLMLEAECYNGETLPILSQHQVEKSVARLERFAGSRDVLAFWFYNVASFLTLKKIQSLWLGVGVVNFMSPIKNIAGIKRDSLIIKSLVDSEYNHIVLLVVGKNEMEQIVAPEQKPLQPCSFFGKTFSYLARPYS